MDHAILKKKISTFRGEGGKLRNVSDELLGEILVAWESWTGPSSVFYSSIGVDYRKMAGFLGKAKKLKREGRFADTSEFKEIQIEGSSAPGFSSSAGGIELSWSEGKVIRFSQVEQLVEFLKKAA